MTSQEKDIRPKSMNEEYDELHLEKIESFFDENTGQLLYFRLNISNTINS